MFQRNASIKFGSSIVSSLAITGACLAGKAIQHVQAGTGQFKEEFLSAITDA
jgi:hypothetical protein